MSNDISLLNTPSTPDFLREAGGFKDDLAGGLHGGFGVLSFKGKTWATNNGGTRRVITRPGEDDTPASSIEVVIVKANDMLSKVYYKSGYVEGADTKPDCYSHNGISPEADAVSPQSAKCATCEHNVWGSRITDNGKKGKSCADSRRLAVAPIGNLDDVMLLRVPAASLRDLAEYSKSLSARGIPYFAVRTKIGFDVSVAHPKLTFKAMGFLEEHEFRKVKELRSDTLVEQVIGKEFSGAVEFSGDKSTTAPAQSAIKQTAKPVDEPEVVEAKKKAAAPVAAKPKAEKPIEDAVVTEVDSLGDELDAALAELGD